MEKINFVNNQPPYINATNLNAMQDNIENAMGEIIESGSNSNGNWIKYPDGTMVCSYERILTGNEKKFTTSYGNIYYPNLSITWTFPSQFLTNTIPVVNATIFLQGGVGGGVNLRTRPTNQECIVYPYYCRDYDFASYSASINFIAIGKWK